MESGLASSRFPKDRASHSLFPLGVVTGLPQVTRTTCTVQLVAGIKKTEIWCYAPFLSVS